MKVLVALLPSRTLIQASRYSSDANLLSATEFDSVKSALRLESTAETFSSIFPVSFFSCSFSSDSAKAPSKNDGGSGLPSLMKVKVGLGRGGSVGSSLSRTMFGVPNENATGVGVCNSTVDGLFVGFFVGFLVGDTPGINGGQSAVQID